MNDCRHKNLNLTFERFGYSQIYAESGQYNKAAEYYIKAIEIGIAEGKQEDVDVAKQSLENIKIWIESGLQKGAL